MPTGECKITAAQLKQMESLWHMSEGLNVELLHGFLVGAEWVFEEALEQVLLFVEAERIQDGLDQLDNEYQPCSKMYQPR